MSAVLSTTSSLTTAPSTSVYAVDPEHGRLRLTVLLAFLVSWIGLTILFSIVVRSEGFNLVAVLVGFVAGYGVSALLERQLRLRWKSGREVRVQPSGIALVRNGQIEVSVSSDEAVRPLYWRFKISRRARVPKGWYMYACALDTDDATPTLAVYTFLSPQQAETFSRMPQFKQLLSSKEQKGNAATDLRLAGDERRLREAEGVRWTSGAEMTPTDFMALMDHIAQFSAWQPTSVNAPVIALSDQIRPRAHPLEEE